MGEEGWPIPVKKSVSLKHISPHPTGGCGVLRKLVCEDESKWCATTAIWNLHVIGRTNKHVRNEKMRRSGLRSEKVAINPHSLLFLKITFAAALTITSSFLSPFSPLWIIPEQFCWSASVYSGLCLIHWCASFNPRQYARQLCIASKGCSRGIGGRPKTRKEFFLLILKVGQYLKDDEANLLAITFKLNNQICDTLDLLKFKASYWCRRQH